MVARPAHASAPSADAVEFVKFCYQRRKVGWPELYDEMCGVAEPRALPRLGPGRPRDRTASVHAPRDAGAGGARDRRSSPRIGRGPGRPGTPAAAVAGAG